jgi:hypothetical protein
MITYLKQLLLLKLKNFEYYRHGQSNRYFFNFIETKFINFFMNILII